jgi:hypothetical protein
MLRGSGLVGPARMATLYRCSLFRVRPDKEREGGPANQRGLTPEVEAKHFKKL